MLNLPENFLRYKRGSLAACSRRICQIPLWGWRHLQSL